MRLSQLMCLPVLLFLAISASAGDRKVTLTPLSVSLQSVYYPSTSASSMPTTVSTPESRPTCPEGTNQIGNSQSSVLQCRWNSLPGGSTAKTNSVNVMAILETAGGEAYSVRVSCDKEYGRCLRPQTAKAYPAELNEDAKWLAKYSNRPVRGPMKIRFRVDGEKRVTYLILNITPMDRPSAQEKPSQR